MFMLRGVKDSSCCPLSHENLDHAQISSSMTRKLKFKLPHENVDEFHMKRWRKLPRTVFRARGGVCYSRQKAR
jgi:hypothetical protein